MNPRNFFAELKRRNVYKVAVACPAARSMDAHNFLAKLESQNVHAFVESCHSVGKEDHGA